MLPTLADQAERLIALGVPALNGMSPADLRTPAASGPAAALLVTAARPSAFVALLTREGRPGFVTADMTDVDEFRPTDEADTPEPPYLVTGLQRGDEFANRTPEESLPEILGAGRRPLTLVEGLHWVLQAPEVLERNKCFMTIGSRLKKANGAYDARTPALWISNGTGRDGREQKDAPKVGWCWWGNRHTWLGIASCSARSPVAP